MQRVCLLAVQRLCLCTGDALFTQATSGEQMFFLRSGRLRYYPGTIRGQQSVTKVEIDSSIHGQFEPRMTQTSLAGASAPTAFGGRPEDSERTVREGAWFCESSLWCPWAHWGTMVAVKMSEVLALNMAAFVSVTSLHRLVARSSCRYAAAFVQQLNANIRDGCVDDISQVPTETLAELARHTFGAKKFEASPGQEFPDESSTNAMTADTQPRAKLNL